MEGLKSLIRSKSIYTLITAGKGKLEAVYPALLAIINNIAPHVENLGRSTSQKLIQLFNSMSTPSFLFANEGNHALLQSVLEALNAIIEHQFNSQSLRTDRGETQLIITQRTLT